jgi:hypothetical protein
MNGPSTVLLGIEELLDGLVNWLSGRIASDDAPAGRDRLISNGGAWPAQSIQRTQSTQHTQSTHSIHSGPRAHRPPPAPVSTYDALASSRRG